MLQDKNMEKYEAYRSMTENLSKALKAEFYYQAIFIEYAILEDRCTSALKHAGITYINDKGFEIKLSTKINRLKDNPAFSVPFVRQRISLKLLEDIEEWKRQRDRLIHALARIPYNHEEIKKTALHGQELVRILSNKVKSVNNYYDKLRKG